MTRAMARRSRRRRTPATALLALVIACTTFAVFAVPATADDGHTVKGYLSLQDSATFVGKACEGAGGYTDLAQGTPVVIRDGDGQVIGTGHFSVGKGARAVKIGAATVPSACVFAFTVKHVPDADTYSFAMSYRGGVVYTHEELEANNWRVGAALGPEPPKLIV